MPPGDRSRGLVAAPETAAGVPLAACLARHGNRPAVLTSGCRLSYAELGARVAGAARRLGGRRRLVLLEAANEIEPLVWYLAALGAGHPVLVVGGGSRERVDATIDAYDPDVVIARHAEGWALDERREGSAHELHPDLALLLSTSGSTGSSKLVRLSRHNVQSNAESIAQYLRLRDTDRAITSLPMEYCYGLSVIHSHVLVGGALVPGELSVVDRCFWDALDRFGVTGFAGVPYTFELLDRVGFESMTVPSLRYITQAGGRLDPETVGRYARLGRRRGWDLFVMYGQTEATARMAYLPPEKAVTRPSSIGHAIPGGSIALEPPEGAAGTEPGGDAEEGEIVFRGPNVMMGYARGPADLALGRTVEALRTGDLARRVDGLLEVIGRTSRFVKMYGLRIDLDQVEQQLRAHAITALCTGSDDHLAVGTRRDADPDQVVALVASALGVPQGAIRIAVFDELPRLPNGKPDHPAVRDAARPLTPDAARGPGGVDDAAAAIRDAYRATFAGHSVDDGESFVTLGGDSLTYVEMSVVIEEALGYLPEGWHTMPLGDVVALRPRKRSAFFRMESNVVLRTAAILLIVGRHAAAFAVAGGGHLLLGVSGYNVARFQLAPTGASKPSGRIASAAARVAVPSVIWIALLLAFADGYGVANVFLLNDVVGPGVWDQRWRYWYVEALVQMLLVLALVLAIPAVRRWERRHPYPFVLALLALAGVGRLDPLSLVESPIRFNHPLTLAWFFVLGWAIQRSTTVGRQAVTTALIVFAVPGFFGDPRREAIVGVGLALLLWVPRLPVPRQIHRAVAVVASASLYIYLIHWHVYPTARGLTSPLVAAAVSVAVGIGARSVADRGARLVERYAATLRTARRVGAGETPRA